MFLAIAVWRQHPVEIEASLLAEYGAKGDIADWHNGRMTSRRLLNLIRCLPDTSKYQRACSATGWSEAELIAAKLHEVAATRLAALYAGTDDLPEELTDKFGTFIPPNDREARAREAIANEEFIEAEREKLLDDMFSS